MYLPLWGLYLKLRRFWRPAVVAEGRLYRSAQMPPSRMAKACATLGVRTVIDLRRQADKAARERVALEGVGVRHVHLVSNQTPRAEVIETFLRIMDDPANLPVLTHCTHGIGRTGVLAAVYRMEYEGWSNEDARREAQRIGGFQSFRPEASKGAFVLRYAPRKAKQS